MEEILNKEYDSKFKYIAVDGDGRVWIYGGKPLFSLSYNCKLTTIEGKRANGMWIYGGRKSQKQIGKVEAPLNPQDEIYIINQEG